MRTEPERPTQYAESKAARDFDLNLEAQQLECSRGIHPPGAREIRGGVLFCTCCGRKVRP